MTKLVIQIPCFNEEQSLGATLDALPKQLAGVDEIEVLIIDDGSTDKTLEVARAHGVTHLLCFKKHRGLAAGFMAGLRASLAAGADIIVNTDADNQYEADDIPLLIAPLLRQEADIVVGARPIATTQDFSFSKKLLQRMGSFVVQIASGVRIPDAPSGFRAFNREAAQTLNVFGHYTYTLETLIQAGRGKLALTSVDIRTHAATRPSRLVTSIPGYVWRSALTIVRTFMAYRPLVFFGLPAALLVLSSFALGTRFIFFYQAGDGGGHVQSLILAAMLSGGGITLGMVALIADLLAVNRKLLEKVDARLASLEASVLVRRQGDEGG